MFYTLLFGLTSGTIAAGFKNRSFFWWFLLGLIFGPFALLVIFIPSLQPTFDDLEKLVSPELLQQADEIIENAYGLHELDAVDELKEMGVIGQGEYEVRVCEVLSAKRHAYDGHVA